MELKARPCGHLGCLLTTTKNCCSCEDQRPIRSSYSYYRDGKGVVKDSSKYARYWAYCPTCKYQLLHLREGRKRCACGLVKCDLTTEKCCICLDKRPVGEVLYKYVDGKGLVPVEDGRGIHYCPCCQARVKRKAPDIDLPTSSSKAKATSQLHHSEERPPITALAEAPRTPLQTISCTAHSRGPNEASEPAVPDYDDVSDYEVIEHVETLSDKACQAGRRARKKASRGWWGFARLR